MTRRVVVTGMGAITPIGNDVKTFWENLKAGVHGIGPITKFDASELNTNLAAEVKDFNAKDYMDRKEAKRMDPYSQYAVAAAGEAVADAGLDLCQADVDRIGVYLGTGIGGIQEIQTGVEKMIDKGIKRVNPLFVPVSISNMGAANISMHFGLKGPALTMVTACASANNAIGEAFRYIKHGYADIMLAGGAEGAINEIGLGGFDNLTATSEATDPDRASIPFDKDRNGFVMGEGAGILVLESLEGALARGAKIYAEIVGYGATSDAYHLTQPSADGSGAAKAMLLALEEGGIAKEEVSYINAHGTGTPANDSSETVAIKRAFGEDLAYKIPVSSTKSAVGHLLGAAGAVEAVASILAIHDSFIPATLGFQNADPACDLDIVPNVGRQQEVNVAISNTLGFGGHNTVIAFKKVGE
ncbi:beta-ketoacyl-[acyl-carrier-protein] synthase II [Aerococcus agrisoli]|uniref:3-oxoacyl-[acyl-carrier-protein] synthase 2 n=1 Tax=Aerococcus agrisoli TaxID=2487350 RepID=A0A3N4GU45_9LACT|nr:beta-ketoacyl-ACP synthase II [Aerococcus agrisoli]RPA64967.1 beta-ketoacyl-[acyl-carrier-protein] synthase II [Aerococcus agrisoli]